MAISNSIGTPYARKASSNSALSDASGEVPARAKVLAAPTDPRRATPSNPEPVSFRNSPRSNVLWSWPEVTPRTIGPADRNTFPPSVFGSVLPLQLAISRAPNVTVIIRTRGGAGQRSDTSDFLFDNILGRIVHYQQYAVPNIASGTPHGSHPGISREVSASYGQALRQRRVGTSVAY